MASALTTYLFGIIGELTSSYELALLALAGLTLSGSAVLFLVGRKAAIEPAIPLVRVDETRSIPIRTARESNIKQ